MKKRKGKHRSRMKVVLLGAAGFVAVWMLGDFLYSRIIDWRMARWEATIKRGPEGVRIGCEAFTVGQGEVALLMVHGINDSPAMYRKMAPLLADQGFTCRAMRLPGFAMPIDDYAAATHEQWIDAIQHEASRLRQTHERVCIVAHSLGGAATIAYLLDHPEGADRCVLIAPGVAVSDDRSPVMSARAWHTIGNWALLFTRVTETPFANDARDPAEQDYASRTKFCPRAVFDELFELMDKNRARADQFRTPLLMVLSKDDRVIDWQAAKWFFDEASSAEKKLLYVKNAGHAIPVDYGWREVADEIAEFARDN
ncbi:MAG: lysophospholipase [Planctomycetes bacterium]|nr:lysophospholipase [Planctomycetota bacterium]